MTTTYSTISSVGKAQIADFIARYHKRPDQQVLDAWVEAAENNMANNSPDCATIEIRSFDAVSGHTESLTIEGDGLTVNEIEE